MAGWALCAALPTLALLLASGCGEPPPDNVRWSLLAVGDTGADPNNATDYARALAVGNAMADEDQERPVDALLLLGDNFYPNGLKRRELIDRVRSNVVRQFCHFVAGDAKRYREVADACMLPLARRHPIPIYALLGNHDYDSPESPELQRSTLPQLVSNWQMARGAAEVSEVLDRVSLVLVDSEALLESGSIAPLVAALRAARGPWRVLASHRPMAMVRNRDDSTPNPGYAALLERAIAEADVNVQLVLSGHEHWLAVLEMDEPNPPLHVISGAGSDLRKRRDSEPNTRAEFKSLGYVRLDWVGPARGGRMLVSLYRVPRYAWLRAFGRRRLAARWSVDVEGEIRRE